jgi:hypothetical protein
MFWMKMNCQRQLDFDDPTDHLIHWKCFAHAFADADTYGDGVSFVIGGVLADEIPRSEFADFGASIWEAADGHSCELEAAWAAILDSDGKLREDDFEGFCDPVVSIHQFELHPDFAEWRLAMMDAFCNRFGDNALIVLPQHVTDFNEPELEALGFSHLPPTVFAAPFGYPVIDRESTFLARENLLARSFEPTDYPHDPPPATRAHQAWVKAQARWDDE